MMEDLQKVIDELGTVRQAEEKDNNITHDDEGRSIIIDLTRQIIRQKDESKDVKSKVKIN